MVIMLGGLLWDERSAIPLHTIKANSWEGEHFSVKKGIFSEKGGGNSVNDKDFYGKGN